MHLCRYCVHRNSDIFRYIQIYSDIFNLRHDLCRYCVHRNSISDTIYADIVLIETQSQTRFMQILC